MGSASFSRLDKDCMLVADCPKQLLAYIVINVLKTWYSVLNMYAVKFVPLPSKTPRHAFHIYFLFVENYYTLYFLESERAFGGQIIHLLILLDFQVNSTSDATTSKRSRKKKVRVNPRLSY